MFAMFQLGHPDVLPVGDLGVRKVREWEWGSVGGGGRWAGVKGWGQGQEGTGGGRFGGEEGKERGRG